MTTRITTDLQAIEWIKENEPDTVINEDWTVTERVFCMRCGGTGRYGWQGVCWACNGKNSKSIKHTPVKKYAQREKSAKARREKLAEQRQKAAEVRKDRLLEGQRNWCEQSGYGRITFAEKKQIQAEYRAKINQSKVYIGEIGMKLDLEVTFIYSASYETHFGVMRLYTFQDEAENYLVWKTSKALNLRAKDRVRLRGTIKEHKEYRQTKQTVLTRCTIER